jgi:hypothetical protein
MFSFTFVVVIVCLSVDFSFSLLENKKVSGEGFIYRKMQGYLFREAYNKVWFSFCTNRNKNLFSFFDFYA